MLLERHKNDISKGLEFKIIKLSNDGCNARKNTAQSAKFQNFQLSYSNHPEYTVLTCFCVSVCVTYVYGDGVCVTLFLMIIQIALTVLRLKIL